MRNCFVSGEHMKKRILGIDLGVNAVGGTAKYNTVAWQYYTMFNPYYVGGSDSLLASYNYGKKSATYILDTSPAIQGFQEFESTARKRPSYNDVINQKISACNFPFLAACKTSENWPPTVLVMPYYRLPLPPYATKDMDATFNGTEFASARAWNAIQPRFSGDVQLLNSIFELKDFKDAGKALLNIQHEIYNVAKTVRSLKKKYKGQPSKLLAEGWLAYALAFKPTINDVNNIMKALSTTVAEAQLKFADAGTTLQKTHYSEVLSSSANVVSYNSYYPCWYYGQVETRKFTATLEYTYQYKLRRPTEAFMAYWGINGSVETLWNASAFTWVADYFIQIGNALHFMQKDPNVGLSSRQYCESILHEFNHGQILGHLGRDFESVFEGKYYNVTSDAPLNKLVSGYKTSTYVRRVCDPNKGLALPRLKLPSSTQGKTLLALARSFI